MQMDTLQIKQILSLVRGGDYAHAGEEGAIELALDSVSKLTRQVILDVGCGLGGSAEYVHSHGWGSVIGIDANEDMIAYAETAYPDVEFHACDVLEVANVVEARPDVILMLNSFYSFADQQGSLTALRRAAAPSAQLIIFDYVDRGGYRERSLPKEYDVIPFPLVLDNIDLMLNDSGWMLDSIEDINDLYLIWYQELMRRIERKRDEIVAVAGQEKYDSLHGVYTDILSSIEEGVLGGAIVRAYAE
ncbi:MAG: methyltransferase domain-containing protein [Candidatus Latescibacterota bacterium]